MKKQSIIHSLVIILMFFVALYGNRMLHHFTEISIASPIGRMALSYGWWLIPIILTTGILYGFRNIPQALGLDSRLLTGLIFGLIEVSPMLISSALMGKVDPELEGVTLAKKTLFAGFMEELLFRGFLFGLLFRKAGWGFIPAVVIGAIIFGLSHLYQGSSTGEIAGIFMVTFIASGWFAWLYIEWKDNLWVPIFLHIFMNLSWTLFTISDNALGGVSSNVFRFATIAITVIATILMGLRRKKFRVNGSNLLLNQQTDSHSA